MWSANSAIVGLAFVGAGSILVMGWIAAMTWLGSRENGLRR
jgi:hypothetical protein